MNNLHWIEQIFRQKKIYYLALISLALLSFVLLFFCFTQAMQRNVQQITQVVSDNQQIFIQQKSIVQRWNVKERNLETIIPPVSLSLPQILETLSKFSQSTGLKIRAMQPLASVKMNGLIAQPIQLEIWGNFYLFLKFLEALSQQPFVVALKDFQFTAMPEQEKNNLDMNLTFIFYAD